MVVPLPNMLRAVMLEAAISGGTGSGLTIAAAAVDLAVVPFPFFISGCKTQQVLSECPPGPHLMHVYQLSLGFPHEVKLIRVDVEAAGLHMCCIDKRKVEPWFLVRQLLLSMICFQMASGDTLNRSDCVARKADTKSPAVP